MGKYSGIAASAKRLIEKRGLAATLRRPGANYDPIAQVATAKPTSVPIKLVRTGIGTGRTPKRNDGVQTGSLVLTRSTNFVIAMNGVDLSPQSGDEVVIGSDVWRIAWVDIVDPALDGAIIASVRAEM